MPYQLTRILPSGRRKTYEPTEWHSTAVNLASLVLISDAKVSSAEADRFAFEDLENAGLGETVTHAMTGWSFRIDNA